MKRKLKVNNRLKGAMGMTTIEKGKATKIEINVKAHKGSRKELADTITHELMHARHPKMLEKTVRSRTAKAMKESTPTDHAKAVAKMRMKRIGYAEGAIKRKLGMGRSEGGEPGSLISRAREKGISKGKLSVMGLI